MTAITECIEINASPEAVFALVANLCRRAGLNPAWRLLECQVSDPDGVREGTRCRFLIERAGVQVEHTSEVIRYEPPHRIGLRSEVFPDLEIHLLLEPSEIGCRLCHQETFQDLGSPCSSAVPEPSVSPLAWLVGRLFSPGPRASAPTSDSLETSRVEIRAWLAGIKAELENPRGRS